MADPISPNYLQIGTSNTTGANQTINASGIGKILLSPGSPSSYSAATFSETGRDGYFIIEAENGNVTINHTASGPNVFVLAGGANLPLPAGQNMIVLWSIENNNWEQVGGYGMPGYASPQNVQQHRAIIIGDSLLAQGSQNIGGDRNVSTSVSASINSFVVSGGVVTVTFNSGHPHCMYPGCYFSLFNIADNTFTTALNGAVLQCTSIGGQYTMTFPATFNGQTLPDATYVTGSTYNTGNTNFNFSFYFFQTNVLNTAWYRWLNLLSRSKFTLTGQFAQGGTISTMLTGLTPNIVSFAQNFDYAFIQTGTNDINTVTTDAAAATAVNTIMTQITTLTNLLTGMGKRVVIGTPPPVGVLAGGQTTAVCLVKNTALAALRRRLMDYAKSNQLVDIVDNFANCINGLSTTGDFLTNYTWATTSESIHISTVGMINSVKNYLAQTNSSLIGSETIYESSSVSIIEDNTNYAQTVSNPNLQVNSGFAGTTAVTGATGVSGTVPTGCTPQASTGSSTHVCAGQTARYHIPSSNSNNWTYGFTVTSTWTTANGDAFQCWLPNIYTALNAYLTSAAVVAAGGAWFRYSIEVTNTGTGQLTPISQIQLDLNLNYSTGLNIYTGGGVGAPGNLLNDGLPLVQGDKITVSTEPFYLTTGMASLINTLCVPTITITGVGAAGSPVTTIEFASPQLRPVSNPYGVYIP